MITKATPRATREFMAYCPDNDTWDGQLWDQLITRAYARGLEPAELDKPSFSLPGGLQLWLLVPIGD